MSALLAAAGDQSPQDVGTAGPIGLLFVVLGLFAVVFLVRSMNRHLKRVPRSFDPADAEPSVVVPDTPAELLEKPRRPGQDLLDTLRRAPRAIEGPKPDGDRPDGDRPDGPASRN
jgi:hypothetical protein